MGNVLTTITDKKVGQDTSSNDEADYYMTATQMAKFYYPFGWEMPGRKFNSANYRHGFNGKENDREWGDQLIQDYGFRLYNPAIGKFLSVDPLSPSYPWYTPYQFAGNKPIRFIDLDGLEEEEVELNRQGDGTYKAKIKIIKNYKVINLSSRTTDAIIKTYINEKLEKSVNSKFKYSNMSIYSFNGGVVAKDGTSTDLHINYSSSYNISFVNSVDEISSTDVIVAVVDDLGKIHDESGTGSFMDVSGYSFDDSRVIGIEGANFYSQERMNWLMSHEEGHKMGLPHKCKHTCSNLMSYLVEDGKPGDNLTNMQYSDFLIPLIYSHTGPQSPDITKVVDREKGTFKSKKVTEHGDARKDIRAVLDNPIEPLERTGHTGTIYNPQKLE